MIDPAMAPDAQHRDPEAPGHISPHAMTRLEAGRVAGITLTVLAVVGVAWLLMELTQFLLLVFAALG